MENLVGGTFAGRRVFVTGHTGFKGGWLALSLVRQGATVRGYALDADAARPSLFELARIGQVVEDCRGDIRDAARLDQALKQFAPDTVFHLAAQPLVRRSYADPVGTYATNVMGTANLLQSIRAAPSVRAVVVVTTDKCYLNREWLWGYRETEALGGHDPYSSSKACVEILCASYRSSFFAEGNAANKVGLATARAGNVIGGGDWSEDRLIPDLIRGFIQNQPVPIRRPLSVRPWQHVLEPVAGYLLLAARLLNGEDAYADAWNLGPGEDDAWTVERIANVMARRWGGNATWLRDGDAGVHEAGLLKLDASKARAQLGWQPQLQLETALEWVVDWYRAWQNGADMQAYSLEQIVAYDKAKSIGAVETVHPPAPSRA